MSHYQPFHTPFEDLHRANLATLALFKGMPIKVREGFYSTGIPNIQFVNAASELPVDVPWFSNRLRLGNGLLSSGLSPFLADGLHITLVKWGPGDDDCGRVDAHESAVLSECSIVSYCGITVEEDVMFGPGVYMFDCDQSPADPAGPRHDPRNMEMAPIHIEHHAWVGANVIIMPGVRIGHHATVSTGSVVTRDVAAHSLAAGNPAVIAAQFT